MTILLTVAEVAEELRVSERTVRRAHVSEASKREAMQGLMKEETG